MCPQYLADDCRLTSTTGRRQLRSSKLPRLSRLAYKISLGDRFFAVPGPRLLNSGLLSTEVILN